MVIRTSLVALIAGRELRDLGRDRRTIFLLLILPALLYPGFGLIGYFYALSMLEQVTPVGVVNSSALPAGSPLPMPLTVPALPGVAGEWVAPGGSVAAVLTRLTEPALIDRGQFLSTWAGSDRERLAMPVVPLDSDDPTPLETKAVDALLIVSQNFTDELKSGGRPVLQIKTREGDEMSKLAGERLQRILAAYRDALKRVRLTRHGLNADFDDVLEIRDNYADEPPLRRVSEELRDRMIKFFPFMLVMWTMAGALHPAIDLCAGEKERGTMETLLISPAERVEIVVGKFLAVAVFAVAAAYWNLFWMGGLTYLGGRFFGIEFVRPIGYFWSAVFVLPMAALFSALSLGLGVYARSSKEGQYYLLPLFLAVLPLVLLSVAPNAELTWTSALIPVTGPALLLQQLMRETAAADVAIYFVPVMLSLTVCVSASLAWAVGQFHREDVLFREAERIDLFQRLRHLFRGEA